MPQSRFRRVAMQIFLSSPFLAHIKLEPLSSFPPASFLSSSPFPLVRSLGYEILAIGLVNFVFVDCCDQMNGQFLCKLHLNDHQTCRQPLQAYLSSSPPFILSVFSWYSLSIFPDLAPSERASMVIDCQIVIAKTSLAPSFLPFSRLFLKPPPCAS